MDTQQQCSTQDGGIKTKKYTREELFKLAKLMDNSQSVVKDLDRYENADWSQYNLDLIDSADDNESKFNSIKHITGYGRKNSELDHEYSSLTDHRVHNDWRRSQAIAPMTRLSRMTSSPSIRYGANNIRSQINAQHDDVPIQIKAKYAKLIESMSAHCGYQQQTTNDNISGSRSDLLIKDSNGSSWRTSESKPAERPTTLFGPLRKETPKQKSDRRNSEEPISLPHIPDHNVRNQHSGRMLFNTGARGLLDYNNPSPVQRFTSSDRPKKENQGTADEEDDFDITSLLNITVLSDIKIIRQDQQHHHGSNNRPTFSRQSSNRSRTEDVGGYLAGVKPLLRARTSTDFTYQGRKLDGYNADQERINHGYFVEHRTRNGPESLDSYRWSSTSAQQQVGTFENREMARERQIIKQSKENSAPVDKNVAQIIETFKAQVKARAEEKLIEPLATETKAASTSTYAKSTCEGSQGVGAVKENVSTNFERKINDLNLQREEKEVPSSTKNLIKDAAQVVDKLLNDDDKKLQESTAEKEQTKASESFAASNAVQKTVIPNELTSTKPLQSNSVSQIPRLIRLLDSNKIPTSAPSNETKAVLVSKEQQLENKSLSTSATTTKAKPRFVSQYRRLRGKSLADEMEDMPK